MSKASDRRYEALTALNAKVVTVHKGATEATWLIKDRATVASMIRELAPLGRTQRWQGAIETWAIGVEQEQSDLPFSEWAFFQYGIWASYAAE